MTPRRVVKFGCLVGSGLVVLCPLLWLLASRWAAAERLAGRQPGISILTDGWNNSASLRLHFRDTAGRPVDNVTVYLNLRVVTGRPDPSESNSYLDADRDWDYELPECIGAELSFLKEGYFDNMLTVKPPDIPGTASIVNGRPLVERTIVMMRENEARPEMLTSTYDSTDCEFRDSQTTGTLWQSSATDKPRRSDIAPLHRETLQGIGMFLDPAPGIEVVKRDSSYGGQERISPVDHQAVLQILGGQEGDGFVRVQEPISVVCPNHFPFGYREAPASGYVPELRLSPQEFATPFEDRYMLIYFRFRGRYGKIVFQRWEFSERSQGFSWDTMISINKKPNSRDVTTPPCY